MIKSETAEKEKDDVDDGGTEPKKGERKQSYPIGGDVRKNITNIHYIFTLSEPRGQRSLIDWNNRGRKKRKTVFLAIPAPERERKRYFCL